MTIYQRYCEYFLNRGLVNTSLGQLHSTQWRYGTYLIHSHASGFHFRDAGRALRSVCWFCDQYTSSTGNLPLKHRDMIIIPFKVVSNTIQRGTINNGGSVL